MQQTHRWALAMPGQPHSLTPGSARGPHQPHSLTQALGGRPELLSRTPDPGLVGRPHVENLSETWRGAATGPPWDSWLSCPGRPGSPWHRPVHTRTHSVQARSPGARRPCWARAHCSRQNPGDSPQPLSGGTLVLGRGQGRSCTPARSKEASQKREHPQVIRRRDRRGHGRLHGGACSPQDSHQSLVGAAVRPS